MVARDDKPALAIQVSGVVHDGPDILCSEPDQLEMEDNWDFSCCQKAIMALTRYFVLVVFLVLQIEKGRVILGRPSLH